MWVLQCRDEHGPVTPPQTFTDPKTARESLPHVDWVKTPNGWAQRDWDSDEQWEVVPA